MIERDTIFVDGKWLESAGTGTITVVNPATEEPIATVPRGDVADVDRAVQAAARAFETWSRSSHEERAAVLTRIADILEGKAEELTRSTVSEIGTPIALARRSHVATPINDLRIAAGSIKDILWETFHIFFRHFNFPCALGLRRVGNPNERSPVFLSGNYTLTVQRVLRKLRGCDCYLLVANSRGSNVWCAAGMNEFTEYDVIDVINVSGIKDLVRHRRTTG